MDLIDKKILKLLQENSRISNSEIARQIGMVPSGVLERIRKLEENGYIKNYTTTVNPEKINLGLLAFVFVRTDDIAGEWSTADELSKLDEIMELHHVAGEDCYLLKVRMANNKALADFMREKLTRIKNIKSTRTVIVLDTVKETSKIKLPEIE
ncbi:MAG: Lrp/AsnC family transcriptional regulator [Ignavibacteria bacterium]|jgi:Lrp/AsnC family leucine-responsive transcriptional regulator